MLQGVWLKTPEFSSIMKIVVTCKPFNIFTSFFFLLKTEFHTQRIILYQLCTILDSWDIRETKWDFCDGLCEPNFLSILNHCIFCKTIKIKKIWNLSTRLNNFRFCIQNLQMDISFKEKNPLHGLQVTAILGIQENWFF